MDTAGNVVFNGVECPERHLRVGRRKLRLFRWAYRSNSTLSQTQSPWWAPSTISILTSSPTVAIPASSAVWDAQPALLSLTNPAGSAYQVLHFTAPATSTSTTLTFTFRDDPGFSLIPWRSSS
jgi:hypothetical protein